VSTGSKRSYREVHRGISEWVSDEEYQIYVPLQATQFVLNVSSQNEFLIALAADVNRCATAAFESTCHVIENRQLPRSTAWLVIKSYYAAFFAAHSISRMFGTTFTPLDKTQAKSVNVGFDHCHACSPRF
jgi:hypothetical protein